MYSIFKFQIKTRPLSAIWYPYLSADFTISNFEGAWRVNAQWKTWCHMVTSIFVTITLSVVDNITKTLETRADGKRWFSVSLTPYFSSIQHTTQQLFRRIYHLHFSWISFRFPTYDARRILKMGFDYLRCLIFSRLFHFIN